MYRLRLLGGVVLEGPSGPVTGRAVQPRRLALLAVLGSSGELGWSREKLIALLWPDTEPTEARRRLSQSVYLLRQALGEASLVGLGETLSLDRDLVVVDSEVFEATAEGGRWDQAVDAYRGPFLDGFFIRDSGPFEEWADSERRRLADMFATCLEAAAKRSVEAEDHLRAAERWRRLIEHDPYNSRAVVGLMEALSAAGDPGNALLAAAEHAEVLREDLGLGYGPDVGAVVERIRELLPAAEAGAARPPRRRPVAGLVPSDPPSDLRADAAAHRTGMWTLVVVGFVLAAAAVWAVSRLVRPVPAVPVGSVAVQGATR
jgi:DNA-binding SARP family transcriptional activator